MLQNIKPLRAILRHKNKQIREERTKLEAMCEADRILSAYLALLIEDRGGCETLSRSRVSEAIGKYDVSLERKDNDYVLRLKKRSQGGVRIGKE